MHNRLFDCKYPILEASMNTASDLALAIAVAEAGAHPSFDPIRSSKEPIESKDIPDYLYESMQEFKKNIGNLNIVIAIPLHGLLDKKLVKVIGDLRASHVEIFPLPDGKLRSFGDTFDKTIIRSSLAHIGRHTKILTRLYDATGHSDMEKYFDGFLIKGKESAGKTGEWSVQDLFDHQIKNCDIPCIPYGGIGTPQDVRHYIDRGAPIVGVGTLFAMSKESCLSAEVKEKLLKSNIQLAPGTEQNIVILKDTSQKDINESIKKDWNKQDLLNNGIFGRGEKGIVYAGHGLSKIDKIRSVKETVQFLISELDIK